MPYIKMSRRKALAGEADMKKVPLFESAGELNYMLTISCNKYLTDYGTSYKTINDIIGALECAKQEFYRRIASPYEDLKIRENGEVYIIKDK